MKFNVLGIGAGGNKAALELIKKGGIEEKDVVLVNSTDKDLPKEFKGLSIILKPDNSGCGKERIISKEYIIKNIQANVFDNIFDDDVTDIMIVTSVEGGTGSGATPLLSKYINEVLGKNVHICALLGFEEDARGLQNSVEFFQDVASTDVDIMTIKNSSFLYFVEGNKFEAEKLANLEFVKRFKILSGYYITSSDQNIDDTDLMKVVSTVGYKTVEEVKISDNLTSKQQFNKLVKESILKSKSLLSKNGGQIRMAVILNIKPESEDYIDYNFEEICKVYGTPYEKFLHKQYKGGEEFIQFISSGMKLPLEEIKEIHKRYQQESSKVDKSNNDFLNEISKLKFNEEDSMFNMSSNKKIKKSDFISSLESKAVEQ